MEAAKKVSLLLLLLLLLSSRLDGVVEDKKRKTKGMMRP